MAKDASDWEAAADYDYLDTLAASDLAWEWLRRNEGYEHDFAVFDRARPDAGDETDLICERWGLRFPDPAVAAGAGCARLLAA